MQVRNVTSPLVVSRGLDVTAAAATRMSLPVVEDSALVGIVTEIDLLRGQVHHDARSPLLVAELAIGPPPTGTARRLPKPAHRWCSTRMPFRQWGGLGASG
jgi:CBS domain-containing protein